MDESRQELRWAKEILAAADEASCDKHGYPDSPGAQRYVFRSSGREEEDLASEIAEALVSCQAGREPPENRRTLARIIERGWWIWIWPEDRLTGPYGTEEEAVAGAIDENEGWYAEALRGENRLEFAVSEWTREQAELADWLEMPKSLIEAKTKSADTAERDRLRGWIRVACEEWQRSMNERGRVLLSGATEQCGDPLDGWRRLKYDEATKWWREADDPLMTQEGWLQRRNVAVRDCERVIERLDEDTSWLKSWSRYLQCGQTDWPWGEQLPESGNPIARANEAGGIAVVVALMAQTKWMDDKQGGIARMEPGWEQSGASMTVEEAAVEIAAEDGGVMIPEILKAAYREWPWVTDALAAANEEQQKAKDAIRRHAA